MKVLTDETTITKEQGFDESLSEPKNFSVPDVEKFYAKDRHALRKWLEENYATSTGAWMIYDKKVFGNRTLSYDDIVEEAICFGWIDSLPRSLDDKQGIYSHGK